MNVAKHLKWHGLVALATAAASMIMLRGLNEPQLIVGVSLPPAVAVAFTSHQYSTCARTIAWAFLVWLGIGATVSHIPFLFPNMTLADPQLNPSDGRYLTWFSWTIGFWTGAVVPWNIFRGKIHLQQHGEDVQLSALTRTLGVIAVVVVWLFALPMLVVKGGLWPVF